MFKAQRKQRNYNSQSRVFSQFSELFITDLPVSIKGSMVEGGVSSAVHTIHIRSSPDTVERREDCYKTSITHAKTQTNSVYPSVKSLTEGVTDYYLRARITQPSLNTDGGHTFMRCRELCETTRMKKCREPV